ncbi:YqzE family protein [Cohnella caldifontis]|uniref:YqzE family protein n=1 Tax=Cohnella caldifontis TaxID=3027471 RepID=UPI0023ECEDA9|nr:YqzE family protein [Cohnella sp. YIM B05605]
MSDGADFLKYVTERVVTYWETPKAPEERRERRMRREPWVTRWFGQLLPVGIGIWLNSRKGEREEAAESPGISQSPADYA